MAATIHKLPKPGYFGALKLNAHPLGQKEEFTYCAVIKGAPDRLFPFAQTLSGVSGAEFSVDSAQGCQIKHSEMSEIEDANAKFSEQALRVIAVCLRPLTDTDMAQLAGIVATSEMPAAEGRLQFLLGSKAKEVADSGGDKRISRQFSGGGQSGSLVLLGLLGAMDPPRAGVKEAVERCRKAQVRVVMITGDQKNTACAIAKNISILQHGDTIEEKAIVCAQLHNEDGSLIEKAELDAITRRVNVFSRAQPEDKMVIVRSLQDQQMVVAMTGDGVNDAPALQAADIGVSWVSQAQMWPKVLPT
jgi:magnesium-transporting ATPase (P-type)